MLISGFCSCCSGSQCDLIPHPSLKLKHCKTTQTTQVLTEYACIITCKTRKILLYTQGYLKQKKVSTMAQHLARSCFFYCYVFFSSEALNQMTSRVKAVPTQLPLNCFSQRISFSLICRSFFFTL